MRLVVGFVAALLVVAVVFNVVMVLVAAAAVYGCSRLARAAWRSAAARRDARNHARAELLARADLQHRWWLAGDPRGTYGRFTPARVAVRQ